MGEPLDAIDAAVVTGAIAALRGPSLRFVVVRLCNASGLRTMVQVRVMRRSPCASRRPSTSLRLSSSGRLAVRVKFDCQKRRWVEDADGVSLDEARRRSGRLP
jgi:hypothetical protein